MAAPCISVYDPERRWPSIEAVESTDWEHLGELRIARSVHDEFLEAIGCDPHAGRSTAHHAVVACFMLGALRNSFPLPNAPGQGVDTAVVQTDDHLQMHSPVVLDSPDLLVGRLVADGAARAYRYEAWLLDPKGVPVAFNDFTVRLVSLKRFASK